MEKETETVKNLLTKGLDRLLAMIGLSITEIGFGGDFLEIMVTGKESRGVLWIVPKKFPARAFTTTNQFKIGYKTLKGSEKQLVQAVLILYKLIQKRESKLDEEIINRVFFQDKIRPKQKAIKALKDPGIQVFSDGRVELRVTLDCNEECPFCIVAPDPAVHLSNVVPSPSDVPEWIRKAKDAGASIVVFGGGEPTLLDDLPQWVKFAKELGLAVWLQTNGIIPSTEQYWKRFEVLPDSVLISFHTIHPDRVELLTGIGGTFSRKISTLRILKRLGIPFYLHYLITSINLDELLELPHFLYNLLGITGYSVVLSYPMPFGRARNHPELFPRLSRMREVLDSSIDNFLALGMKVSMSQISGPPPCTFPSHPELVQNDFLQELTSFFKMHKIKVPQCSKCKFNEQCTGIWKRYLEWFKDDEILPVR